MLKEKAISKKKEARITCACRNGTREVWTGVAQQHRRSNWAQPEQTQGADSRASKASDSPPHKNTQSYTSQEKVRYSLILIMKVCISASDLDNGKAHLATDRIKSFRELVLGRSFANCLAWHPLKFPDWKAVGIEEAPEALPETRCCQCIQLRLTRTSLTISCDMKQFSYGNNSIWQMTPPSLHSTLTQHTSLQSSD